MKNPYNYKAFYLLTLLAVLSCNKEPCKYETANIPQVNGCVDSTFAGYMVSTMGAGLSTTVGVINDTRLTSMAPLGQDWNDPILLGAARVSSIAPAMWVENIIGQVFGIALDYNKGIFLSASDIYAATYNYGGTARTTFGPGGRCGIYYTDITNPNTTTTLVKTAASASLNTVGTALIPNSGVGPNSIGNSIGNIAYDQKNNQLFATNLEDGRIYRINPTTGIVLSIFDPFVIDNAIAGMAPVGEQLWGIGIYTDSSGITSVFFSRTKTANAMSQSSPGAGTKDIWSIKLDSNGEFVATEIGSSKLFNDSAVSSQLEILNVPSGRAYVTDIAFSKSGKMLLAERGYAHQSKVFEYIKTGTVWAVSAKNFFVGGQAGGNPEGENAAGGIDYGSRELNTSYVCDDIVWASGNFMLPKIKPSNAVFVYSIQGISAAGNLSLPRFPNSNGTGGVSAPISGDLPNYSATDIYIHTNINSPASKGSVGDVEVFRSKCCN